MPDAQGAGGDLDAPGLQALHHLGEALALDAAEQAVGRGAVVVEGQLAAFHALVPGLGRSRETTSPGPCSTSRMEIPAWRGEAFGSVLQSKAISWEPRVGDQVFEPLTT